jgi:DNA topoisomerase IA
MFSLKRCRIHPQRAVMADQIVITEKTSQAKDVRAAVGSHYGDILLAEGHLFDLLEPEDVVPAWKRCVAESGFGSPPIAIARVS